MVSKYTFSFTGASALINESIIIAEEYYQLKDWVKVKDSVQKKNLMNKIKDSTFQREFREIKKRLELLTNDQLFLLIRGGPDDAKAMILLSLLKSYSLFRDIVIEVIRTKFFLFESSITDSDYIRFANSKSLSHQELNIITEKTAQKVRTVLFRMLEEIGLITSAKEGIIIKPYLSDEVIKSIVRDDASWLSGFLFSDSEIKKLHESLNHEQSKKK